MNCETTMPWILLETSGELPASRRADLAAHLASCPACREYRASLDVLRTGTRADAAAIPALDAATLTTILSASEAGRRRSPVARPSRSRWLDLVRTPALAYAAAALFAFGLGFGITVLRHPAGPTVAASTAPAWTMDEWLDVELDLLNSELAATSADWTDSAGGSPDGSVPDDVYSDPLLETEV